MILYSLYFPPMAGIVVLTSINYFLFYSFFYIYYNGYIVLQYNLMLGNMTEERSMDLAHDNMQFSNKIYFNESTVNNDVSLGVNDYCKAITGRVQYIQYMIRIQ